MSAEKALHILLTWHFIICWRAGSILCTRRTYVAGPNIHDTYVYNVYCETIFITLHMQHNEYSVYFEYSKYSEINMSCFFLQINLFGILIYRYYLFPSYICTGWLWVSTYVSIHLFHTTWRVSKCYLIKKNGILGVVGMLAHNTWDQHVLIFDNKNRFSCTIKIFRELKY